MPSTPSLAALLRRVIDDSVSDIHVAIPGVVERYDAATQTADVLPIAVRWLERDDEPSEDARERLPVLPNVPVVFPSGGGYMVTFPVAVGDSVLLVIASRSIEEWRTHGRHDESDPIDPRDQRLHDLTGAFAIPCIRPAGRELVSASGDHMVMGKDAGEDAATIHIRATEVRLGSDAATDYVALASKVNDELEKISTTLLSLTGGSSPPASFTTPYERSNVDAEKVKAI
ncbi:MAG: hypothetical protein L6Q76_00105 [Polyangiaceae bacterium]|nr:hypothetical protein [Polyangiaceae bacterium]